MDPRKEFEARMSGFRKSASRRRRPDRGGSEPVTVEPNRPKLGEGGATAALEFGE
jgi:hypothetical protein